jgi:hypothetical protein
MPKPRVSFDDGSIAKVHSGKVVNNRPVALPYFRFTTGDIDTSEALAEFFRASVVDTRSDKENHLEIETDTDSIEIVLSGAGAISADMKLWINGKLTHHCDGIEFLSPPEKLGLGCNCAPSFKERQNNAKEFRGPSPSIKMLFRIMGAEDLGLIAYQSGSWKFAEMLGDYGSQLSRIGGPAVATFRLELVEFMSKTVGKVSYRKPVLENIRPYNDALAE